MVTKQNLVKSKFPFINTFNHTVPAVVRAMCYLTVSYMDVDQMIGYTQKTFRGSTVKKYKTVLAECKELAKGIAGDQ